MNHIDCFKCRHLVITWDQDRPYACQGMGFKSRRIPSLVVKQASGQDCLVFSPKPKGKNRQD
ncbi:MAG: uracil-DNA glycosylase [Deltaproteobacteria bacterium]|nr:uracil-DNA glycosylase [Deltaproteobacteria bacterium]